jgi:hypothetical protein
LNSLIFSALAGTTELTPNTRPSFENLVFDPTLYALACLIAFVTLYAAFVALRAQGRFASEGRFRMSIGTGLVALGFAMIIITVISLLVLFRAGALGGFLYLQAEFSVVYLGCAFILLGMDRIVFAVRGQAELLSNGRLRGESGLRLVLWIAFLVSVGIASAYLFDPATYTVTAVGGTRHVSQEGVFWLPPFVTLLVGAIGASTFALVSGEKATRMFASWLALFFAFEISGILRESNLIPSVGDPLADMLMAFVPLTVGSFCLAMSARRLRLIESLPRVDQTGPNVRS